MASLSGFVRRGGFGVGRLIVSRGYGYDGRDYPTLALACLSGTTQEADGYEGYALNANALAGIVQALALFDGAASTITVGGEVTTHPTFTGRVLRCGLT